MNLLLYFHRLSKFPTNIIADNEIKQYTLADEVQVSNRYDSNIDRNSTMIIFKVATLEAIKE